MLTIKKLKEMQPDTIFAKGSELIIHPWFNDECPNLVDEKGNPDKKGRYVKVKIGDTWCEALSLGKDIIIQTKEIPKNCIKWEDFCPCGNLKADESDVCEECL